MLNVTVILLSRDLSLHPLHHQAQNNINRDCFLTSVTVTQVQQKSQVDRWGYFPAGLFVSGTVIFWKMSLNNFAEQLSVIFRNDLLIASG